MTNKKTSHPKGDVRLPDPNSFFKQIFEGLKDNKTRQDEIREQIRQHESEYDKPNIRKLNF